VYPQDYENHVCDLFVLGTTVELDIWKLVGVDYYDRMRPLSYPGTHVSLVCFAIDSPDSLDNVQEKVC
jgi:Ras homolog gene family, member A